MTIAGHGALLLLANALLVVAGAGVTRALGAWSTPAELRRAVGVSFAAGLAAYGVLAQLLYVCGLSLRLWEDLVLVAALAATGALRGRGVPARPSPGWGRAEVLAAAAAVVMLVALGVDALVQPLASWDAWTQWTPKAIALVVMHGLDPHVFGSAVYRHWHIDYPLLVPAVEAYAFRFIGIDTRVIHLESWCFFAAFASAFVDLLRPRVKPLYVWSTLLAIVFAPKLLGETVAANADVPLGCFVGLAAIAALIWLTEQDRVALGLLALFAAAAVATKVEGTYLVVVLVVVTALFAARVSRRSAFLTVGAGIVALVGIVPWRIWVSENHLPATYSIHDALAAGGWHDPSRGPISTLVVVGELFSPAGWLLLVPLGIAAAAVVAARRGRPLLAVAAGAAVLVAAALVSTLVVPGPNFPFPWRVSDWGLLLPLLLGAAVLGWGIARAGGAAAWMLLCAGLMTATFVLVYVVTPYPFAWHLGTSSARVVIGPGLFVGAVLPLLLGRAVDTR